MHKAVLVLKNGTVFKGFGAGFIGETSGEVVFNTSMTGYQEILTDPSYYGQIVTMTYPLIGNYGINFEDVESNKVQASGFVVKQLSKIHSNHRANGTLNGYLEKNKVVCIENIDTRKLTRIIRITGAMNGIISNRVNEIDSLLKKLQSIPEMLGLDLVPYVSIDTPYEFGKIYSSSKKIIAIDCGIKTNILRMINDRGINITVVPYNYSADKILELKPDGVFLSNGPGDPAAVKQTIETIKNLIGKIPIFGICLGHQMLSIALGAKTYKLKFGHRGGNHPVKNLLTGKVEITSQNHGFAVSSENLPSDIEITHINLNDNTIEGIRHKKYPVFSVQYHPEASPGPHDSHYLFDEFVKLLNG